MRTFKNGEDFDFTHKNNYAGRIYHATVLENLNRVFVSWSDSQGSGSVTYTLSDAYESIEIGQWTVVEKVVEKVDEEVVENLVNTIKIGDVDHHFAKLENGDVLIFKMSENDDPNLSYRIAYTTITQQEFDAIKKAIDLK